ncbi:MAG: hypothetical protein ACI9U2_000064 [Bradymonadia bacterium]|jgi:hypothetical protein
MRRSVSLLPVLLVLPLVLATPAWAVDPLETAIDLVAAEKGAEKDAAVIVAIEDYANVSDISGARANARLWRQWFSRRGTTQVKVIQNAAARHQWTKSGDAKGILAEVDAAAKRVKKGGTLWFVFIGHGAPLTSGNQAEGALLAQDVEQTADSIEARGIGIESDLLPRLAKAGKAVAILDACFSGKTDTGKAVIPGLQPLVPVSHKAPGKVTVFTAARDTEFAGPLPGKARPAFSYLMLGALSGWADGEIDRRKDKKISAAEAHAFVETQLGNLIQGRSQTPTFRGPDRTLTQAWAVSANLGGAAKPVAPPVAQPGEPVPQPGTGIKAVAWSGEKAIPKTGAKPGLSIEHSARILGMQGAPTELSCYVYQGRGGILSSPDKVLAASNTQVAISRFATPSKPDQTERLKLFIPEKELHLNTGTHDLKVRCEAFASGKTLGKSDYTYFKYTVAGRKAAKSVVISGGKLTHNHVKKGQKGLRIHHRIQAKGMKDREMEVSCFFRYDDASAKPLKDFNKRFNTLNGKVSVTERVKVMYEDSNFADYQHFIPYDELHLGPGKTKIKLRCQAFDNGKKIGGGSWLKATYTGKGKAKSKGKATFTKARMEHNARDKKGLKGLRLRHHLQVKGMKGKRLEVTCYFYDKKSGNILKDRNGKFKTSRGDVSVADYVTLKYADSTFKEFKHFIPYSELHITKKGKHKLKTRCAAFDSGTSVGTGPWQYLDFNK